MQLHKTTKLSSDIAGAHSQREELLIVHYNTCHIPLKAHFKSNVGFNKDKKSSFVVFDLFLTS